jgi:hypothetical protein
MLALVLDEVLNYESPANGVQGQGGDMSTGATGTETGQAFFSDMPMIEGLEPIPTEAEDFLNWLDNATWNNIVSFFFLLLLSSSVSGDG